MDSQQLRVSGGCGDHPRVPTVSGGCKLPEPGVTSGINILGYNPVEIRDCYDSTVGEDDQAESTQGTAAGQEEAESMELSGAPQSVPTVSGDCKLPELGVTSGINILGYNPVGIRDCYDSAVGEDDQAEQIQGAAAGREEAESMELSGALQRDYCNKPKLMAENSAAFHRTDINNFLKGCKWSPDGTCLMSCSEDKVLRLFDLPSVLYTEGWAGPGEEIADLNCSLSVREGGTVYDYCWYSRMTSDDPVTACFLSSCQDAPIHLWDAYSGSLRSTYKAINQLDEISPAYSLCFTPDGSTILAGFNKVVRMFDVSRPGRQTEDRPTYKRKAGSGQSGIISCFSVHDREFACGSYDRSVAIYTLNEPGMVCLLQGQTGGVTQVEFSPDGNRLYAGGRIDDEILCWDVRQPGELLFTINRRCTTNQRLFFTSDPAHTHLASSGSDGTVNVWDVAEIGDWEGDAPVLDPVLSFSASEDCVNGASYHPTLPILATSSGTRRFNDGLTNRIDDEESDSSDIDDSSSSLQKPSSLLSHNSLRLWWLESGWESCTQQGQVAI